MRNNYLNQTIAAVFCAWGSVATAQDTAPLSAIDWLSEQPASAALPGLGTNIIEPETSQSATVPSVTVRPLGTPAARRVGLVPSAITGLPETLWSGSNSVTLAQRLTDLPTLRLPALQQLALTLLLAEADPPRGQSAAFDLARVDALLAYGALDPAMALMDQAGADRSRAHLHRALDMALIAGNTTQPCAILRARPTLSPGKPYEVFCAARAGDWNTAVLQLGTARALGLISARDAAALERFLDPELFEGAAPLPLPVAPDPLMFRVHRAVGEPIPTGIWPAVYANADLSDTSGWKAQIEAAERLAQKSALSDNQLLGLYTQRQAAASGSVWDRVAALQRFETALETGNTVAISKTLPAVWRAMHAKRLRVTFATLFAERLEPFVLAGQAADVAFEVLLLSPRYESAAQVFPARAIDRPVLTALASGSIPAGLTPDGLAGAAIAGFSTAAPDTDIVAAAQSGQLGVAMLDTLALVHAGSAGDVAQFATGLATLRVLGLEDVARRVALQTLLLEQPT